FRLCTALVALTLLLAACGGSSNSSSSSSSASSSSAPASSSSSSSSSSGGAETASAQGKQVFDTAGCKNCHTLKDAGSTGTVGPNLDDLKPDEAAVQKQVENGGGPMPAFKGKLSDAQITAVSQYVSSVAGQS